MYAHMSKCMWPGCYCAHSKQGTKSTQGAQSWTLLYLWQWISCTRPGGLSQILASPSMRVHWILPVLCFCFSLSFIDLIHSLIEPAYWSTLLLVAAVKWKLRNEVIYSMERHLHQRVNNLVMSHSLSWVKRSGQAALWQHPKVHPVNWSTGHVGVHGLALVHQLVAT